MEFEVILLKFDLPDCGIWSDFVWLTPIHEVLVISSDDN